jgi:hypothetical protein
LPAFWPFPLALPSPTEFRPSNSQRHLATQTAYRVLSESHSIRYRFELCQRPCLNFHPVGGSNFGLRPLFLLRNKGSQKEMTGTESMWELFKTSISSLYPYKIVLVLFHKKENLTESLSFAPCYLVATSAGSKSQLFQCSAGVAIVV